MVTLKDKVVVVTGGTAGIGAATVEHCAALGAHVVFTGRDRGRGAELARRILHARFVRGDVTARDFPESIVRDSDSTCW